MHFLFKPGQVRRQAPAGGSQEAPAVLQLDRSSLPSELAVVVLDYWRGRGL